jgi:YihY family inner membrane protein
VPFVERVDRFQRKHHRAGFPIAVVYKYFDDQGNYLAAIITYYAIVSLVPLLLLLSTILNYTLANDPELQQRVLDSALGQFPVVGAELSDPHGVSGSGLALAIGIVGTIYGALGVAQAVQNAMNTVWRVPRNKRPNPIRSRLRSIVLLLVLGLAVLGTTLLSGLSSVASGYRATLLYMLSSMLVNVGVFLLGFRVATARHLPWHGIVRGAIAAAVGWQILQYFGASYVTGVVKHASALNGVFAFVLGLIVWIYLEAVIVVFAVEYNAVRELGLYPRALLTPFTDNVTLTRADELAYTGQAESQQAKGFEAIAVSFDRPPRRSKRQSSPPPDPDSDRTSR